MRKVDVETVEPSGKPARKEAMADLYPLIVENEEIFSNMETRKSAILPKEAVYGSHEGLGTSFKEACQSIVVKASGGWPKRLGDKVGSPLRKGLPLGHVS